MAIIQKNNLRFAALQSFYWGAVCMTSSFMVLYLQSKGYDPDRIGIILAVSSVAMLVGQYFWGFYCNTNSWFNHKNIILLCLFAGIGVNLLFPYISLHYVLIIVCYFVFSFTLNSIAPMIDAWTMIRKIDSPEINYGLTRGIGSAVYAVSAVGFGYVFRYTGIELMFLFSSLFIGLALITTMFIERGRTQSPNILSKITGFGASVTLLRNSRYVMLLLSLFLIFIAFMSNGAYYGLLIRELGGTTSEFGLGIFLMAISEVPVMIMSAWLLTKFSARLLLSISFVFFLLKAICLALSESLLMATLSQLCQSFSFGLFLPVCLVYITQIVKESELTLAFMLLASVSYGLSGIIGNPLGGWISQEFGLATMYDINTLITATGLGLFIVSITVHKFRKIEAT